MKAIGEELKAARLAKGLSLEDVQQDLKIRLKYLRAIEDGRIEEIPGLVYARGFIRSYARLLGVEADEEVVGAGSVSPEGGTPVALSRSRPTTKAPPHPIMPRRVGPAVWVVAGLVVILGLAVTALVRQGPVPPLTKAGHHPTVGVTSPDRHHHRSKPGGKKVSTPPSTPPAPAVSAAGPASMTERGGMVISGEAYHVSKAPLTLTVKLNGPCWIQVLADGVYQTPGVVGAGTQTFVGTSKLSVVLGAPVAVTTVTVNGQVITPFAGDKPTAIVLSKG